MIKELLIFQFLVYMDPVSGQDLSPEYIKLSQHVHSEMHHEYEICMKVADNRKKQALMKSSKAMDMKTMSAKMNHLDNKSSLGLPILFNETFNQGIIVESTFKEDQEKCKELIPSMQEMANKIERQSLLKKIPKYEQQGT